MERQDSTEGSGPFRRRHPRTCGGGRGPGAPSGRRRELHVFFYATQAQGDPVTSLSLGNDFGEVILAGVDVQVAPRWYVDADIKQIVLNTTAKLTALGLPIKARTAHDPTVFCLGIGCKFWRGTGISHGFAMDRSRSGGALPVATSKAPVRASASGRATSRPSRAASRGRSAGASPPDR